MFKDDKTRRHKNIELLISEKGAMAYLIVQSSLHVLNYMNYEVENPSVAPILLSSKLQYDSCFWLKNKSTDDLCEIVRKKNKLVSSV